MSSALELAPEQMPLRVLLSRLAVLLAQQDRPCLWVVDGVPDGLSPQQLALLRGPHLLASTLLTTRSRRYGYFAEPIDLAPLDTDDAYTLLTSRRAPDQPAEQAAARALVVDLGGHPQALDIVAERAGGDSFVRLRSRLHTASTDVLSQWGAPAADTFHASPRTLTATLPHPDAAPTGDVLRLLAVASPTPLTSTVLERSLAHLGAREPWHVTRQVAEAIDVLSGEGVIQPMTPGNGAWTIHPLTARATRFHDTDAARQEDLRRALLRTLAEPAERPILEPVPAVTTDEEPTVRSSTAPSPGQEERGAAFDLQIELVTRVGVQPLAEGQGSLREALTSLHTLLGTAREALHRAGADATSTSLPRISSTLANDVLRPFLTQWHTALLLHEAARPEGTSPIEHERNWNRSNEMRSALTELRPPLIGVVEELAELSGSRLLA